MAVVYPTEQEGPVERKLHKDDTPLWSPLHTMRFIEERFEKDVFLCYQITETFPYSVKIVAMTIFKGLWFFLGIYIAVNYYITDQDSKYVSLQTSSLCTEVPIPVTGEWTLDREGFWLGNDEFSATHAFVSMKLFQLTVTLEEFEAFIGSASDSIQQASRAAVMRDSASNMAHLMAWQIGIDTIDPFGIPAEQFVRFTADAAYVFDRFYQSAALGGVSGDCDLFLDVAYDRATGMVTTTVPHADFINSSLCSGAADPKLLGYVSHRSGPNLKIKFDVHSLVVAYAVNDGIVPFNVVTEIYDPAMEALDISYGGDRYEIILGVDEKYPGMEPVYCLTPVTRVNAASSYSFDYVCLLKVGNEFVYPTFNHAGLAGTNGYDSYTPKPCNCTDGSGNLDHCHDFDFLAGFMMFNGTTEEALTKILTMAYEYAPVEINELAFNASFAAGTLGSAAEYPHEGAETADQDALELLSDPAWRAKAYEFCSNCTMMTVNFYDNHNHRVSGPGLQVYNSSCASVITEESVEWDNLSPPTKLTQDYYECQPSVYDSIINGIGIGTSDSCLFVPILIIITVPILHVILHYMQSKESKIEEKERFNTLDEDEYSHPLQPTPSEKMSISEPPNGNQDQSDQLFSSRTKGNQNAIKYVAEDLNVEEV